MFAFEVSVMIRHDMDQLMIKGNNDKGLEPFRWNTTSLATLKITQLASGEQSVAIPFRETIREKNGIMWGKFLNVVDIIRLFK